MEASQWPKRAYHLTCFNVLSVCIYTHSFRLPERTSRHTSCFLHKTSRYGISVEGFFPTIQPFIRCEFAGCFSSSRKSSKLGTLKITSKSQIFQCGELWRFRFRPPHLVKHNVWQPKPRGFNYVDHNSTRNKKVTQIKSDLNFQNPCESTHINQPLLFLLLFHPLLFEKKWCSTSPWFWTKTKTTHHSI